MVSRDEYRGMGVDAKVELIRNLVPLGLIHVYQLLDEEVEALRKELGIQSEDSGAEKVA